LRGRNVQSIVLRKNYQDSTPMFLPRVLEKKKVTTGQKPAAATGYASHGIQSDLLASGGGGVFKSQVKEPQAVIDTLTDEEINELVGLIELSLSNYALWCNPELRKLVETRQDGCKQYSRFRVVNRSIATIETLGSNLKI
jgi:hypothetical protein